jgi:hypothetical protein
MISAAPAPREAGGTYKCAGVEDQAESLAIFKIYPAAGFGENSPCYLCFSRNCHVF